VLLTGSYNSVLLKNARHCWHGAIKHVPLGSRVAVSATRPGVITASRQRTYCNPNRIIPSGD